MSECIRPNEKGGEQSDYPWSQERIKKIRDKALNRPPKSEETKNKGALALMKRANQSPENHNTAKRPVILYNLNGTIYGKFFTLIEAANAINCSEKTIRRALQTKKKLVKRQ